MRIGSVCSGYGGLDLATMAHFGADLAWVADPAPAPAAILAHHWPAVPNHGDITQPAFLDAEPIDILTAGYPCQPFSKAGQRKGTNDERHLWPAIAHAVGVFRPRYVVLENVAEHLSMGFDAVLRDLAAHRYDARWRIVRASDAGAAHARARLFCVATNANVPRWPEPSRPVTNDARHAPPTRVSHDFGRFGTYAAAIARWERITGRTAPNPTDGVGTRGQPLLSAAFTEWLMGLPAGHVTDPAIGLSRRAQLITLGNGVVPQQAGHALQILTTERHNQ